MLDAEFGGSLETLGGQADQRVAASLLRLPGVGPETADAILLYALGMLSRWLTSICAVLPSGIDC